MQMLSQFVTRFEDFMVWIKQQPAESEESIRRFEDIFNVTKQTHLLRNIQDIKDELCMLEAVFSEQKQVLLAAGEEIDKANYECTYGCEVDQAVKQSRRCPHSTLAFADQSEKHWKQIKRMQAQANQAYDTVSALIIAFRVQIKRLSNLSAAQGSSEPQAAASKCARSASQPQSGDFFGRAVEDHYGLHNRYNCLRKLTTPNLNIKRLPYSSKRRNLTTCSYLLHSSPQSSHFPSRNSNESYYRKGRTCQPPRSYRSLL
jgi:hypothetical protein